VLDTLDAFPLDAGETADTDGDGHSDFEELDNAYNPISSTTTKMSQKIEITLKNQKLIYYVGGQKWREFIVSTGKPSMPTPLGDFKITNKSKKAWSKTYGLWMPFWLGLNRGGIGIHELPVWPNGYREGENHLGKAVSHGCIRLGVGSAQYLFDRVSVGTQVSIIK
jgi:lipoprotein-anchoring transpeptidase ErfK/SrfK